MASTGRHDPRHHTQSIRKELGDLRDHLRTAIDEVGEPQLEAMFETSAEVLGGLLEAIDDYQQKNESAWR
jgi:hypothetical protein